jgi:fermentation-respiration switch protein FrsA (DUF1100 family)
MILKPLASTLARLLQRRRFALAVSPVVLSILTAAGCGQLAQKERELVFRVEPGIAGWYSGIPADVVETHLPMEADGAAGKLHAWWWPARRADAPAVLYLHGARWNLSGHLFRLQQLRSFGFSVLAIDYRGFGQSIGDYPSERAVYEDALVGWQHLVRLQPDPARRLIYGHSLGGAVAVDLAARLAREQQGAAAGLIVESSFSSLADIARWHTREWLPLQWILSQKFDSARKIGRVGMPVLIVHGSDDRYVPPHLSEKLYAAARGPKKLLLVEGGSHNNAMRTGADAYRDAIEDMFGLALRRD